jgi:hypothetical protein
LGTFYPDWEWILVLGAALSFGDRSDMHEW